MDMVFDRIPDNISTFWHLGNALPCYLEEIGGDIDFLILDTVHSMPGEMLDFLAALPYLSSNAIVILHDITLNKISDIGAFQITEDTLKYVEKCFSALTITWKYDLTDDELERYRIIYKKFYHDDLVELFNKAITINRKRMLKEKYRKEQTDQEIVNFHRCVMSEYKLILYGGGYWAELISQYLQAMGKEASAYVVSNEINLSTCKNKKQYLSFF